MHDNGENASPPPNLPPSNPNPNPNPNPIDSRKHTRKMENLKAAVFARLAETHPNKTFSPSLIAAIERRLAQAFPSFQTPTHPTYASMIQEAIRNLEQKDGSTEGSISGYILKNFKGLPWAHKSYLRHYLGELFENGEIVCTSSNCYTIPGLFSGRRWKKRQLRPNAGRKRKTYEGDLGGEELIGINETEVCFEDEETQVFTKNQAKRKRRRSLVVYEEDEEVGEKEGFKKEDNVSNDGETPVIEGKNEVLLEVNGGDDVGKEGELKQHGSGTDDIGGEDAEPQAGLVESIGDKLMPKEVEEEVRTEVVSLDHDDASKGKTEQLGPSTMEKAPPVECEDGLGTERGKLGHESGDANLMLIPIESEKKSAWEEDNHIGTSGDVPEKTLNNSAIMERNDHSFETANLMIVPFMGDTPISAPQIEKNPLVKEGKRIIVCSLPCQVSGQPKRKQLVYRPRLKRRQKKPLLLLDESLPDSLVGPKLLEYGRCEVSPQTGPEIKLDQRTSSPHGTTPSIPVEEGSCKLDSEKAESHLEPSPSSGIQELMSLDIDLDVPLNQVLENCCKQRKLSGEVPTSKVVPLVREPRVQNPAKTMPQRRTKELTVTKRKQKQQQQLKKQHKSQAQKCDDLEAGSASAPESGVLMSFHMEKGCDDGKKRHQDLEPRGQGCCVLDGQPHELGENQQKTMDCGISAELEQTREVSLRESSPPQNQNGQKEEHCKQQNQSEKGDVASGDPEPMTAAIMEEKLPPETKESQFMEMPTCPGEIASQLEESQCLANHHYVETTAGELGKGDAHPLNLSSKQQIKRPKRPSRGRPQKQKEGAPSEPKADGQIANRELEQTSNGELVSDNSPGQQLIVEPLSAKLESLCERDPIEDQHAKNSSQAGVLDRDPHFATLVDVKVHVSNQYSEERNNEVKIERRGRPRKQKEDTKDQQNKQPKKDGRGRPRKKNEETKEVAAPLNVHDQLQEGASEQLINKAGDGSPRKEKVETSGNVATPLDSHDQEKERLTYQPSSQQRLKRDGRGRPRKQELVGKEDGAAPLYLRRGRPRKQIGVTKEDAEVAAQGNLGEQLQEGSCDSDIQANKQPKKDGRGRPLKQGRAITEDVAAHKQRRDGLGRACKSKGGAKENEATMSHQQEEEINEKEGKQQGTDRQVIWEDSVPLGTLEAPLSLGNQSDRDPKEQKQHGEDESHKREKEHKEEERPHFLHEQPGKSQGQVQGACCDQEQVTVNETSELLEKQKEDAGDQLPGSELLTEALVDQPSQEEKQSPLHEEKGGQSRDQGKTPKQKSKTKAAEVPLSSKASLRSRTNRQSQSET